MERPPIPLMNLTLVVLREVRGWSQIDLARASGIPRNLLSDYERGRKTFSRERLEQFIAVLGFEPYVVDLTIDYLQAALASSPDLDPFDPEAPQVEELASAWGREMSRFARRMLGMMRQDSQAFLARYEAKKLWAQLSQQPPERRRSFVENASRFRNWALCERICAESIKAAADSADRALELASLALRVAELVPGSRPWRSRVQGYAWAHVGNARRVQGDLPGADHAFAQSRQLWEAGASGPDGILDEALVLGMEASVRIEQLRLHEALTLLDQALAYKPGSEMRNRLLINKAGALEFLGLYEEAIETLQQMPPDLGKGDPRLSLIRRSTWITNLCHLERYGEAEKKLPELQALTARLGNTLDGVRVRWLAGRIAAGLGRRQEAIETLSQVREEFASRGIAYDTAQANLELAVLYLEAGQNAAVRTLARQMAPIFQAQGVHQSALAALKLFRDAAEREALTVDLARRLAVYLQRARYNPELRFEA